MAERRRFKGPEGYTHTDDLPADQKARRHTTPERQRCDKHPRRWETWCWVWYGTADGESDSEPETLHGCRECAEEQELEMQQELRDRGLL